jgi:pentose-5-phosphate-3-epimerase
MKIIPAILPMRYYDIRDGVEKVYVAVDTVQVDFVDGNFAANRTWGGLQG